MPEITAPNLTLTETENDVTINVRFTAVFSELERHLGQHGCDFHSHVEAYGMDPAGSLTGTRLAVLPQVDFPVNDSPVGGVFPYNESVTVSRASLQEDPAVRDDDEIRAKVRIHTKLPPEYVEMFTDQEVLTDD